MDRGRDRQETAEFLAPLPSGAANPAGDILLHPRLSGTEIWNSGIVPRDARWSPNVAGFLHAGIAVTTCYSVLKGAARTATARRRARGLSGEIVLDANFLAGFGTLEVPGELWRAVGRFAVWIEPALVAEWCRLMRVYAARQGRTLDEGVLAAAMIWSEPTRGVMLPRERALRLIAAGPGLRCVWSGRPLTAKSLDMDHCLPWSAWPCGDLWNLLPAHSEVNQHQKRDRLPADAVMCAAGDPIREWWRRAYLEEAGLVLPRQFADEARASLPGLAGSAEPAPEEVFAALMLQRLRLRHDQNVPEWTG